MMTVLLGGAVACVAVPWLANILVAVLVTAAFCFVATFARVVAQPVASTSVIVLVIYLPDWAEERMACAALLGNAAAFLAGAWAAVLSLGLWPLDPFRPARQAVAECYAIWRGLPPACRLG